MKRVKRLFAGLICAVLAVSLLLPFAALRASADGGSFTWSGSYKFNTHGERDGIGECTYELSGSFRKDPHLELTKETVRNDPDLSSREKYGVNQKWHGYISVGDTLRYTVSCYQVGMYCAAFFTGFGENGGYLDEPCDSEHGGIVGSFPNDGNRQSWESAVTITSEMTSIQFEIYGVSENDQYVVVYVFDVGEPQQPGGQIATHEAESNPGEDGGTTIRPDIVEGRDASETAATIAVSVGGALAAAGAAGAALGGSSGAGADGGGRSDGDRDGGEERKKKTYRMKVYKNFGNAIRRGDEAVKVWARIVEVSDGTEINRPDLSERITASGDGMTVRSLGMVNTYMGAEVSVPADSAADRATLVFAYAGEGGVFQNRISFRVIGEPELCFAERAADGQSLILRESGGAVLLLGDGQTCEVLFCFRDAVGELKELKLTPNKAGLAEVTYEKLPQYPHAYKAIVKNLTQPPTEGIFAQPRNAVVSIRAVFENGGAAEGAFNLSFWPEGLSLRTRAPVEDGRIVVNAFLNELRYAEDEDPTSRFVYTDLEFTLAVRTEQSVEVIQPEDGDLQFGKLKGEGEVNHNVAVKYHLTVGATPNPGLYQLQQQDMLYEGQAPYLVELPITARRGRDSWQTELPLRLRGKDPEPMNNDSEVERKKLLFRLKMFVDDDAKRAEWVFLLKEKMSDGHVSAATFRVMSKAILEEYVRYWEKEGENARFKADVFDFLISAADCTKWLCSVCFSYAMEAYAGPVASALLQPVFDLILDSVEEVTGAFVDGRPFKAENLQVYKHLSDAGDNVAANMLGSALIMGNPAAWKKNAQYISMYLAYSFLRNLAKKTAETGEVDIPGAMFDSLKDLTVNMFKIIAGHLFQAWLKNKEFQKQAGKAISKEIQKGATKFFARNGGAAVSGSGLGLKAPVDRKVLRQKFISEEVGADVARLIDWAGHKYDLMSFDLRNNGDLTFTFALWEAEGQDPFWCEINFTACVKNVIIAQAAPALMYSPFGILYQLIFGGLPAAEKPVAFPKDPPVTTRHKERIARGDHTTMRDEYWNGKNRRKPDTPDNAE